MTVNETAKISTPAGSDASLALMPSTAPDLHGGFVPKVGDYIRALANAETKTGAADWPAAVDLWTRVVGLNPLVGRHWVRLAQARFELGDYSGAAAAYTSAQDVGVAPHGESTEAAFPAELAYRVATCHAARGDHEAAVRELRRAFDLGLRDLGRPQHDESWKPFLDDTAVREMLGILDPNDLTRDEGWRTDLAFFAREVKRRAYAPFRRISEPEFDAAVARLIEDVPGLSDCQILVGMMRLLRPLGDGHAVVLPAESDEEAQVYLPLKFYRFDEGLFVIAAAESCREIVGAQVLSIDGHPAGEVLAAVEPLISRDNDQQVMLLEPELLRWTPLLHALGLIRDPGQVTLTVRLADQKTRSLVVASVAGPHRILTPPRPEQMVSLPDTVGVPVPLYLRDTDTPYWFEYLPEDAVVYFQFNAVCDQ